MSGNDRAVITLQVGHYANFIGTHFWNFQDLAFSTEKNDIDHDVIFREGLTPLGNQVTYTPRLVSIDLKGALGSLPEFGDLYHDEAAASLPVQQVWQHSVEVKKAKAHQKTSFLQNLDAVEQENVVKPSEKDLEHEVKVWSDFLRTRFHPKTNVVVESYKHANDLEPFDVFGFGENAWNDSIYGLAECIEDRVRFFAEEADSLKGFQLLSDCSNAFGGISGKIINYLKDEFSGQCVLSFPTLPIESNPDSLNAIGKMLNTAMTIHAMAENCSLVTPMSLALDTFPLRSFETRRFRHFDYDPCVAYHSSAILSCGFDAMTLPWRQLNRPYVSPSEVSAGLNAYGRRVANVDLIAPFNLTPGEHLEQSLKHFQLSDEAVSLSPHCSIDVDSVWCQSVSSRGILGSKNPQFELLGYFNRAMPVTATAVTSSFAPIATGPPFPERILKKLTNEKSLPAMTLWQSSRSSGSIVQNLAERCQKIKIAKLHRFTEAGLEEDEFESFVEDLQQLSEIYKPSSDAM